MLFTKKLRNHDIHFDLPATKKLCDEIERDFNRQLVKTGSATKALHKAAIAYAGKPTIAMSVKLQAASRKHTNEEDAQAELLKELESAQWHLKNRCKDCPVKPLPRKYR